MTSLPTIKTHLWCTISASMELFTAQTPFWNLSTLKSRTQWWSAKLGWLRGLKRLGRVDWTRTWTKKVSRKIKTLTLFLWLSRYKTEPFFFLKVVAGHSFTCQLFSSQSQLYYFFIALGPDDRHFLFDF